MPQQQPNHEGPLAKKTSRPLIACFAFVIAFAIVGLSLLLWSHEREQEREQVRAVLRPVGIDRWLNEYLVDCQASEWNGDGEYFCRLDIPPNDVDKLLAPFRTEVWNEKIHEGPYVAKLGAVWWQPWREEGLEVKTFQTTDGYKYGWSTYTVAASRKNGHVYVHLVRPG